jgi:hypothetical protein
MSKEFYITINGQKVPVTEVVYRAYKRPLWAEHKRKECTKRCRAEHGTRCTKDCSNCPHDKTGSVLSLDELAATGGYEPSDSVDLADLADNGLETDTLGKKAVTELLKTAPEPLGQVLSLRQSLAKSSVSKYKAMETAVCADGRARGMLQFYGANRTGRCSLSLFHRVGGSPM